METLKEKEGKAIQRLKSFNKDDEPYYLCYSGGKDSDTIRILAELANVNFEVFAPEGNKTAPCFEMMYSKETKEVVLLPEAVHINDGETGLTVKHEEKPRKAATK